MKRMTKRKKLLPKADACPNCGQRRRDRLIRFTGNTVVGQVECAVCGMVYRIGRMR